MFVCLCHAVSDKQIESLIRSGAKSLRDLKKHCKAGTDCGQCLCELRQMLQENGSPEGDAAVSAVRKTG